MTKEELVELIKKLESHVQSEEVFLQSLKEEIRRFDAKYDAQKSKSEKIIHEAMKESINHTEQHIQRIKNNIVQYQKMIPNIP